MINLIDDLHDLQLTPRMIAREEGCYCFDEEGDNYLCPLHGVRTGDSRGAELGRPLEITRLTDGERKVRLWFRFPCDGCKQEQATIKVRWESRTEFLCPACKRIMLHLVYGPGHDGGAE